MHHSIADLYRTLGIPLEGELDFTILSIPDIHPQIPFASPKLRADYFSFILTKQGTGTYLLDDHQFPFGARSIYFTNPGHLKSYELTSSKEGYIITLTEAFLREHVHPEIYGEFPFLLAEIVPPQVLSAQEFVELETLYAQIHAESQRASPYQSKILGGLFLVLLLKLKEKSWLHYNPIEEGSRTSQLVKSFKQLLEAESKKLLDADTTEGKWQVQHFAEALHLHPNYLSSVIKSKTGRTVNEWIAERTLSVAKSLLRGTALSSKEIAHRLGFSEATHFSRFFKKHTQRSPGAYRKSADI